MFSDESRFSLSSDSGKVTIRRERGRRFEPRNITERYHFPSRQIATLSHPPSSVTELKRALQVAWNRLSPQLVHHLIASTVNRCAACLAVRGDHTPY
ncbi:transposable element Tc3 transposase [Trichonephila clavipes]|nr:transposable element Tc3 transposase [Trichonephila clavipes]